MYIVKKDNKTKVTMLLGTGNLRNKVAYSGSYMYMNLLECYNIGF